MARMTLEHRDLEIESFKQSPLEDWKPQFRIEAKVIDAPATVRGTITRLPPHDVFLDYLEWKLNKPWYDRIFLP